MIGTVRQQGADLYANNSNGTDYVGGIQVTTGRRSKLFKVVISNIGASPVYLWVNDYTAGSGPSSSPRMVVMCPAGVCTTLDLSDGSPFVNGILLKACTAAPANAGVTGTLAPNNSAIIDASYRLE